jgi:DNA-binding response OmpR family regulator
VLHFEMPTLNGLGGLRPIRFVHGSERCMVMMLTSHNDQSLREACLAAGRITFCTRPISSG